MKERSRDSLNPGTNGKAMMALRTRPLAREF
jgi:hypothetical protein